MLVVILLVSLQTFAQSNFTFSPEKPQAGDAISISYTPSGTITNTTSPLNAVVYTLGNSGENTHDIDLKKNGNVYTGSVKTDTADNFVFFSFSADGNYDNNSNNGYWIQLYDGDSLKKGANLNLGGFYSDLGRNVGLEPDYEKALKAMEDGV